MARRRSLCVGRAGWLGEQPEVGQPLVAVQLVFRGESVVREGRQAGRASVVNCSAFVRRIVQVCVAGGGDNVPFESL